MAPYIQVSLLSADFTKQCICTAGGPGGTQRCRDKRYCELVVNKHAGLVEEAEELRAELQDDWPLLSDLERETKATRLAELSICTKDNGAGRSVEVRDKMLAQRREELARWQPRVPVVPSGGAAASGDAPRSSSGPASRLRSQAAPITAPVTEPRRVASTPFVAAASGVCQLPSSSITSGSRRCQQAAPVVTPPTTTSGSSGRATPTATPATVERSASSTAPGLPTTPKSRAVPAKSSSMPVNDQHHPATTAKPVTPATSTSPEAQSSLQQHLTSLIQGSPFPLSQRINAFLDRLPATPRPPPSGPTTSPPQSSSGIAASFRTLRGDSLVSGSAAEMIGQLLERARNLEALRDAEHREIRRTISALLDDEEGEGDGRDVDNADAA